MFQNLPKGLKIPFIVLLISASLLPVYIFFTQDQSTPPTLSTIDPQTQLAQVGSTLTSGLIAHYKFDEGSGISVGDSTGSNTGSLINGPVWVGGKIGSGALQFDGSNDYINLSGNLSQSGSMTSCSWVKVENLASMSNGYSGAILRSLVDGNGAPGDFWYGINSDGYVKFAYYRVAGDTTGIISYNSQTQLVTSGSWFHICVSWDGSSRNVYINGVKQTGNITASNPSNGWGSGTYIGRIYSAPAYHFNGAVDDLRVYNRALSSSEISELYSYTDGGTTPTPIPTTPTPTPATPTPTPVITPTPTPTPTPVLDVQAPSIPTNLTATAISSTQINLSWSASTDNVSVVGYRIYRGGILLTTTNTTSYSNTGLSASTAYTYTVSAYDASGNVSAQSSFASATTQSAQAVPLGCESSTNLCVPSEYPTIQSCANAAQPGQTCLVSAGTYAERVNTYRAGTNGNPIIFKANGNVIMKGFAVLHNYIVIDGFEITNTGPQYGGIYIKGDNCQIINNYVHDVDQSTRGLIIFTWYEGSPTGCLIKNNRLSSSLFSAGDYQGIEIYGSNHIIENNDIGPMKDSDIFRPFGSNHIIRNNYIHDVTLSSGSGAHMDVIQVFSLNGLVSTNVVFEKNTIKNFQGQLFMIENTNGTISGLTIRNNSYHYATIAGQTYAPINFYNNTLYGCSTHPNSNGFGILFRKSTGTNDASGSNVYNNIFANCGSGPSNGWFSAMEGSTINSDNNLVYPTKPNFNDAHGINGSDPLFVDVQNGNLNISANSPAIDRGTPVPSFSDDLLSAPRPQGSTWDIGAYEYTGVITSTPTPTPATPTPTPVLTPTPAPSLPDTTPPTIIITSPSNNTTISNTVTLSSTASDPVVSGQTTSGILTVQFKLDNQNLGQPLTTAPYSGTWNTTGVTNGNHILTAVATDVAGNTKTSNPINITISNTTPSTPTPTPTLTPTPANPSVPTPTPLNPTPTPSTPASGGGSTGGGSTTGGGGSSGGGSPTGTFTPTVQQKPLPAGGACVPTYSFTRTLTLGSTGQDVKALQIFLNTKGYTVSLTGPGSQNNETTYFGPATIKALAKFQQANNILPATGYLNTATLSKLNSLSTTTSNCSDSYSTTTQRLPKTFKFTTILKLGSTGTDVKNLQIFLNDNGYTVSTNGPGSKGNESTYFGPATQKALIKFQEANAKDILTPSGLTKGTGYFGPSTMKKVNGR